MIIPIGTDVRPRRAPLGNYLLVGLNIGIFMLTDFVLDPSIKDSFTLNAALPSLSEYLTYQFLHGDLTHLAGNMLFLWVFGNAVCDRMGNWPYILFYLAGGVVAGLTFTSLNQNPMLGASGAIASVTTAFLVLYPRVQILMLFLVFIVFTFQVPAMLLIVIKIILWDNIVAPALDRGMMSNVAYSAHLGGYAFGLIAPLLLQAANALPRNQFDLLSLWNRYRRRHGLVNSEPAAGYPRARTITVQEVTKPALPPSPTVLLRENVLDRLMENDLPEAARLYERLRQHEPGHVLPRRQQLELANYLYATRRYLPAAAAYESFLVSYAGAPDAPQVRLILGLIYHRYLQDLPKAAETLRRAADQLVQPDQRQLAEQELQDVSQKLEGG